MTQITLKYSSWLFTISIIIVLVFVLTLMTSTFIITQDDIKEAVEKCGENEGIFSIEVDAASTDIVMCKNGKSFTI